MSAYYYPQGTGYSDSCSWIRHGQRWFICDYITEKKLRSYFAVVDDFGNLTEVDT